MERFPIQESTKWTQETLSVGINFSCPENTRVSVADPHFTLNQMTPDRLDRVLENMSFSMDLISYVIYILLCRQFVHNMQCYPQSSWG